MTASPDASAPSNAPEHAEVGLSDALARSRGHGAVKAAGQVAKLGDQEPLYAAAGVLAVAGLVLGQPRLLEAGVRVGTAVALSDAIKSATKKLVKRSRPHTVAEEDRYTRGLGGSQDKGEQSFPSGHMAATTAAALALAQVYPKSAPAGGAVVAALGATRVLQGEHWPSDVAAGGVIGWLSALASGAAIDAAKAWARKRT